MAATPVETQWFRSVLGRYPTGVMVVTGIPDGSPVGMAVGSFTSVSLDPPLVLFCPSRASQTWPRIQAAGAFCANVLAADQEQVCRTFARSGTDKFAALTWHPAPTGSPILAGAVAWIDCQVERVDEGGDHWIVLGRVAALGIERDAESLVFCGGRYGPAGVTEQDA